MTLANLVNQAQKKELEQRLCVHEFVGTLSKINPQTLNCRCRVCDFPISEIQFWELVNGAGVCIANDGGKRGGGAYVPLEIYRISQDDEWLRLAQSAEKV